MEWIQMNEPGVAASVGTLAKTSDGTLYAVMGYESIYKLPTGKEEKAIGSLLTKNFYRKRPREPFLLLNTTERSILFHLMSCLLQLMRVKLGIPSVRVQRDM